MATKKKMPKLKCQFICDPVPDFRFLPSIDLPGETEKILHDYRYARKLLLRDALSDELMFIQLRVRDHLRKVKDFWQVYL